MTCLLSETTYPSTHPSTKYIHIYVYVYACRCSCEYPHHQHLVYEALS